MCLAYALRLAGGARGIEHHRDIVGRTLAHFLQEELGQPRVEILPALLYVGIGMQELLLVVTHAAWIVVDERFEPGQARLDLEQLVDLFLVLDHGKAHVSVVEDVRHLIGDRILVQRHRHATQALRGCHRPVQAWPIVPHDREIVAARESHRREPACERANLCSRFAPRP
jgi:hypothetical protein